MPDGAFCVRPERFELSVQGYTALNPQPRRRMFCFPPRVMCGDDVWRRVESNHHEMFSRTSPNHAKTAPKNPIEYYSIIVMVMEEV